LLDPEGNGEAASYDVHDSGGPVLALQWDKHDLEWLGLERLDISPSAAMATALTFPSDIENDPATTAAAWRLLEAGDTLSISRNERAGIAVSAAMPADQ